MGRILCMTILINLLLPVWAAAQPAWQQGFDFRSTSTFVTDPASTTYVLPSSAYPTVVNGVSFGWTNVALVGGRNRSASVDPRLAGMNYVVNGSPATFNVDLPSPGTYSIALALGDDGYTQCWTRCQIQYLDGSNVLATVSGGVTSGGHFYDGKGNNWSAAAWPTSNVVQQVTITGTRLTVIVGTNNSTSDITPIAYLGLTQVSANSDFTLSASPTTVGVMQGSSGAMTITTAVAGGFNSSIALSATGAPTGTTVSFNPASLAAPGSGSSTMTISVGASTPTGNYPITVSASGGGITHSTTVNLTVTSPVPASFTLAVSPNSATAGVGAVVTANVTTTVAGGFNNSIALSATGAPTGTSISFNPATLAAPGAGSSTMTVNIGAGTALGSYPITVTGSGGGMTQTASFTLNVVNWQQGFDFRNTKSFVTDPPATNYVGPTTAYPTSGTQVTYGWNGTSSVAGRDRSTSVDPRLAGLNFFPDNAAPGAFYVDLPGAGTYNISLAMGDDASSQCFNGCKIQFLDGATVLFTVTAPNTVVGDFYDANGSNWSASAWPASNVSRQVTLAGTRLTMLVGANNGGSDYTPVAFLGLAQVSASPNFSLGASPSSVTLAAGASATPTITTTVVGGFNSAINLSASGAPTGTTLTLNPAQIPAPGGGSSTLTIAVGSNTAAGTYPITVTATGGGVTHTVTVNLTVTAADFTLTAPSSISVAQNASGTATVTTSVQGSFNSAVGLSASGAPSGTTISFNPAQIAAPGGGSSTMTVAVGATTATGTYPITVSASGGATTHNATVNLTVTASSFTVTASPTAVGTSPGSSVSSTITTTSSGSAVTFSATGLPAGTTATFNPASIASPGAGSSTITLATSSTTPFGSYAIQVTATGSSSLSTKVTLTVSKTGRVNLPAGFGWLPLSSATVFCNASPGNAYLNPSVGAVDAYPFLSGCQEGNLVAYSGGAADTANERYFLWTSGHVNYAGNEMYMLNLNGPSPSVSRITDPSWTTVNNNVPPDCACGGTNNCGAGQWHDGAGHSVTSPYFESANSGPTFESLPAPDGSNGQPSCNYGSRATPNARETYSGMVYHSGTNKLYIWGGVVAADPAVTGALSNWSLDLGQNPPVWTRLANHSRYWYTAAAFDSTTGHPTSGYDIIYDENQGLFAYSSATDSYVQLTNSLPYIGYNNNVELDPVHHSLVIENGDNGNGYHLRIVNLDSCTGISCTETNLDTQTSCQGALGYWAGMTWDSKRNVMAIFPSSNNCSGAACTAPFKTVYLLNPDPTNSVTVTYQGSARTIAPQQCLAVSYGSTQGVDYPQQSWGPGVYSRFKYYPNEDIYLFIPHPNTNAWILRLEQ